MSQPSPFVVQPQLTSVTLAYRNRKLIADLVLPRYPVASQTFKYSTYTKDDAFSVPDTRVGRKSGTNQIDWSATEVSVSTSDYGLEEPIPQSDILQAQSVERVTGVKSVDPMERSTELLTDLVALDREKRVASLVFNTASYASGQSTTLSGTSQWSNSASSPLTAILQALDTCLIRPNVAVLGRAVFTALTLHPQVISAAYPLGGNSAQAGGGPGTVSRQRLAEMLELDQVLVGESWVNTAKKGQAGSLARVWGKDAAFIYQAPVPVGPTGGITFGITGEWGYRVAGTIENDPDIGLRGGVRVRVGESVKELILAPDAGYYFAAASA